MIPYDQETKALAETSKQIATDLHTMFKDLFNAFLTEKQISDILKKGKASDFSEYTIIDDSGTSKMQTAILGLTKNTRKQLLLKEYTPLLSGANIKLLQSGQPLAQDQETNEKFQKNMIKIYPVDENHKPYLDNIAKHLTENQLQQLQDKKFISGPVEIDFGKGKEAYLIGINPMTDEVNVTNIKTVEKGIPSKVAETEIDKKLIASGGMQHAKITENDKEKDVKIYFCAKTSKLKVIPEKEFFQKDLTTDNKISSKYYQISTGNSTSIICIDDYSNAMKTGNLKDQNIGHITSKLTSSIEINISTSSHRNFELTAPQNKYIFNSKTAQLLPFAKHNAQENRVTAQVEAMIIKPSTIKATPDKNILSEVEKLKTPKVDKQKNSLKR